MDLFLNGFRDFLPHFIRFTASNSIRIFTELMDVSIVMRVSFKLTFDFHGTPQYCGVSAIYIHSSTLSFSCSTQEPQSGDGVESVFFIISLTMQEMVVSSCFAIAASVSF